MRTAKIGAIALLVLLSRAIAASTELSLLQELPSPDLVVSDTGRIFVKHRLEMQLAEGETELVLRLSEDSMKNAAAQLHVLSPPSGVEISESYRQPEMTDRVFWRLSSAVSQLAILELCYQSTDVKVSVTYQAQVHLTERLMDLQAKVTARSDGQLYGQSLHVLLPTGDRIETRLEPGAEVAQKLFAIDGIACELRYVYDEKLHGKQAVRMVDFDVPDRGRPLPAGPVTFVSSHDDASSTLGTASMPYGVVGNRIELPMGPAPQVSVAGGMITSRQQAVKQDAYRRLALYDLQEEYEYRLTNRSAEPLDLVFRLHQDGDWDVEDCPLEYTRIDASTAEWVLALVPGTETDLIFTVIKRNLTP